MTRHTLLYTLILLLSLSGCANNIKRTKGAPDWIYTQAKQYPNALYMSSKGQGMSLDLAKDRARADLAKNFEVAIQELSRDNQSFTRIMDEVEKEQFKIHVERDIVTHTDQVLHGVEIADTWYDPVKNIHYALAVLSRQKTAQRLRHEIEVLDNATGMYLSYARSSTDKLEKAARIYQGIEAQWERINLYRSLHVVDIASKGFPPLWDVFSIEADYHKLLNQISFRVDTAGSEGVQKIIASALATSGFLVKKDNSADYLLTGILELDDIKRDNGWYWLRGSLTVTLRDANGRLRGAHTWPLKQSATQEMLVQQRINQTVERLLEMELRSTLLGFAYDK